MKFTKNQDVLKNKHHLKNEENLINIVPKNLLKTFHSYATNDFKPEMLSGVKTGKRISHNEYKM